jgi:hypothetical protein
VGIVAVVAGAARVFFFPCRERAPLSGYAADDRD